MPILPVRSAPRRLLLGVAVAAIAAAVLFFPKSTLPETPSSFTMVALSLLVGALPFIVLGALLASAVQTFLPHSWLHRHLPRHGGARRALLSLLGFALPVCECGNVPLARGLMLQGLRPADALTFLLAAPVLNPITLVVTFQVFGWEDGLFVGRILAGFFIANALGWLFARTPAAAMLKPSFQAACEVRSEARVAPQARWRLFSTRAYHEVEHMLPALLIGALVAAALQVLLPSEVLTAVGANPFFSVAVMLLLAVVVAICSNVDSYFALALSSSFTPGSLHTFLIAAPLIDIKMLPLLATTFRKSTVTYIVLFVAATAAAVGLGVNALA